MGMGIGDDFRTRAKGMTNVQIIQQFFLQYLFIRQRHVVQIRIVQIMHIAHGKIFNWFLNISLKNVTNVTYFSFVSLLIVQRL